MDINQLFNSVRLLNQFNTIIKSIILFNTIYNLYDFVNNICVNFSPTLLKINPFPQWEVFLIPSTLCHLIQPLRHWTNNYFFANKHSKLPEPQPPEGKRARRLRSVVISTNCVEETLVRERAVGRCAIQLQIYRRACSRELRPAVKSHAAITNEITRKCKPRISWAAEPNVVNWKD